LTKEKSVNIIEQWRLGFFGKSVRENASWTESAFEMSSKLGNTPLYYNEIKVKEAAFGQQCGWHRG